MKKAALGAAVLVLAVSGCKSEPGATGSSAAGPNASTQSAQTQSAGTPAPEARGTVAASPNGTCPAGRWSYDFSDQVLETMMKNVAGAKVLKKEGSFICNVSTGAQGTVVCETQGKPVENVVEANQAGMKMVIAITIQGKAATQFALLDAQHMKILSSDASQLKISTKLTLGGAQMPFPTDKLMTIFGNPESTLGYKCEGGKLFLKPGVDKVDSPWQRLDPAP
jgi:hypothetical protein